MKSVSDVEKYIENAPKEIQSKLKELRAAIKDAAPTAEELISYGMPYYAYKGRLVYFSVFKKHIGLYMPGTVIEAHKSQLKEYYATKAALHFPLDQQLPIALIKQLVKARAKENEQAKQ